MKAEFLRAAKFPHAEKKGEEIFFAKGIHDVPEHVVKHPYFKSLVADKMIIEPDATRSSEESLRERQEKMAAKVLAPKAEALSESEVDEAVESSGKSKKKK